MPETIEPPQGFRGGENREQLSTKKNGEREKKRKTFLILQK